MILMGKYYIYKLLGHLQAIVHNRKIINKNLFKNIYYSELFL